MINSVSHNNTSATRRMCMPVFYFLPFFPNQTFFCIPAAHNSFLPEHTDITFSDTSPLQFCGIFNIEIKLKSQLTIHYQYLVCLNSIKNSFMELRVLQNGIHQTNSISKLHVSKCREQRNNDRVRFFWELHKLLHQFFLFLFKRKSL